MIMGEVAVATSHVEAKNDECDTSDDLLLVRGSQKVGSCMSTYSNILRHFEGLETI